MIEQVVFFRFKCLGYDDGYCYYKVSGKDF